MTNPRTPHLNCDDFADTLSDFLERSIPDTTRAAMELHALSCDQCGPLLADLRKLRLDAANLGELVPSRDLWAGISERIETPVMALSAGQVDAWTGGRAKWRTRVWIGLAAAGLVAVTATVTHQVTKRAIVASAVPTPSASVATVLTSPSDAVSRQANPPTGQPADKPTSRQADKPTGRPAVVTAVSNKLTPEQTYDLEISRLRKVVNARRGELDSSTVAVLEKNLRIIDAAIASCKAALEKDPSSRYLNESLVGSLDNKVQLLRAAATLPARM